MPSLVTAPCWIDLSAKDVDAASTFYGTVFGWSFPPQHPDAGDWRAAMVGHAYAGGISPRPEGMPVSMWTVFFGTPDINAAVARAHALGAAPMMPPMSVIIDGVLMTTIALMVDPVGAMFGLAQLAANPGLTHVGGRGSVSWYEYLSRDIDVARGFYADLLGAEIHPVPGSATGYATLNVNGIDIAGTMAMPDTVPANVPAYWSFYLDVPDINEAIATMVDAGATLLMGPEPMQAGTFASMMDPEGAIINVLQSA